MSINIAQEEESISELMSLLEAGAVAPEDVKFCSSLVSQFTINPHGLSSKQWHWVEKMIYRAVSGDRLHGKMTYLIAPMSVADLSERLFIESKGMVRPYLHVLVDSSLSLAIHRAGAKSEYEGSLSITTESFYLGLDKSDWKKHWYGRIVYGTGLWMAPPVSDVVKQLIFSALDKAIINHKQYDLLEGKSNGG